MRTLRIVLTGAAVLSVLAAANPGQAQSPTLLGVVGPGFSIRLTDAAGAPVKNLEPGTYTIRVQDSSDIHNFHLTGPGVNVKTSVGFVGAKSFTVTLKKGTYRFVCDPHATSMKGSFKVS